MLGAMIASAAFAGAIWLLARQRLTTRFTVKVSSSGAGPNFLYLDIDILNRSDRDITIEGISTVAPWFIPLSDEGSYYGKVNPRALETATPTHHASCRLVVRPDEKHSFSMAIGRKGGLASAKAVSIRLHILKRFPVIHHKKKVLTAVLPASTRNSQP